MAALSAQRCSLLCKPTAAGPCLPISRPAARSVLSCSASTQPHEQSQASKPVAACAKQQPLAGLRAFSTSLGMAAASLLATQQASAATEVMQLADRDARFGVVALLFLPVLGWVAFNIGGPALNQLSEMSRQNTPAIKSQLKKGDSQRKPKRGIVAAVTGLGTMAAVQSADAAAEVMQLADRDARFGVVALLFLPVLGWVAFNIGGPALNQLSEMSRQNTPAIKAQLKKGSQNRKPGKR